MLREEIRTLNAGKQQLRSFGITLGIALNIIAGILYWRDISGVTFIAGIGILFLITAAAVPQFLRLLYKPWMTLALILGFIMTRILLCGIYLLLFIPIGLLMRILGKDPLCRKLDPDARTYWIPKKYDANSSDRFERYY